MLRSGVFITPEYTYSVYEVITKGFHRIDFVTPGTAFQVDPNAVVFSLVERRNTFTYGDNRIYDRYLRIHEMVSSAKMKTTKTTSWENGTYVVKIHGENTKFQYTMDSTTHNGVLHEAVLTGDGCTIQEFVVDPLYDVKIDPINFSKYESVQLSKDTIDEGDGKLFYSLDVLKRRYDLRHIEDNDFVVATDIMTATKRLEEFENDPWPFRGFDTETTGTDVCMYGEDHMVGVILGHNPRKATYFPFRHKGDFNLPMSFLDTLMKVWLKFEDRGVAHNSKFDRQVMLKEGYNTHIAWDTLQLSIILNPVFGKKGIHGEKNLMDELSGKHFLELEEIFINAKDIDFSVLPVDIIKYYACPDGSNVLLLLDDMLHKLPKYQYKLAELECKLTWVKADQEYYGIRVDVKKFEKQYRNCVYIIDTLLKAFRSLTHEDGNINSGPVLTNLIYNKMHCPVLLRTDTGLPSTSNAAIKKMAKVKAKNPTNIKEDLVDLNGKVIIKAKDLSASAYPALVILSKYKEYNKLLTAFYARFERTMKTGRIFFWVNQNGAATGRQSSPMHQLPPELKEVILSDADDRDFWGPDYSQIELRMIAYEADETELIELASDPDNDIHRIIGSLISKKPMWAITPEERSVGKRRNFGVVYLISKYGLAGQLKGPGYTQEDVEFAGQQLDAFYKRFKRIDRFIKSNGIKVQKYGYMETKWYHRKRLFTEIFDPNLEPAKKASILRMANNVPVQGTAADYLKLGEVQMDQWIRNKGWDKIVDGFPMVRMMLSIHDEIIISAHNSIPYEEIIEMIRDCMQTPVEGAPPFFVQPARMDNWEGHSDDACAMPIRYRDKVIDDYHATGKSVFHQSYFNLVMSDEVKAKLNTSNELVSTLVNQYLPEVKLSFDHGNYVTEATEEHVKDAMVKYIESGFTTYRIDDYISNLNEFRQGQLRDYMDGLINEYGMDYKAVGEHVRHPSLTFTLLENYNKQIPYDMDHVDRITEAARLYLEDVKTGKLGTNVFTANVGKDEHKLTDKDRFVEQLEPLVNFDENGEVVYSDENESDDSVFNYYYDEGADDIIDLMNNKPVYVWELADCITFDVQNLRNDNVNSVLAYIHQHSVDNGFYRTNIIYNNQIIDTGMRIENINIDEANDLLVKLNMLEAS